MNGWTLQEVILLWEEQTVFWKIIYALSFCFNLSDRKDVGMWRYLLTMSLRACFATHFLQAFSCSLSIWAPLCRTSVILLVFFKRYFEVLQYFRSLFFSNSSFHVFSVEYKLVIIRVHARETPKGKNEMFSTLMSNPGKAVYGCS